MTGNLEEELTNRLTLSQDTIENLLNEKQLHEEEKLQWQQSTDKLQSVNQGLKADVDGLRSNSMAFEEEKQLMQDQINHLRRQIEGFESQKIEVEKVQQQPSDSAEHQNVEQIAALLSEERHRNVSTNLSDVPALLSSIGISDYQEQDFPRPVNTESLLRLCALLIERCKALQSESISSEQSTGKESISITEQDGYEQCRLLIHRHEHSGLDAFFKRLYTTVSQSNDSGDWQINLVKPTHQVTSFEQQYSLSRLIQVERRHLRCTSVILKNIESRRKQYNQFYLSRMLINTFDWN